MERKLVNIDFIDRDEITAAKDEAYVEDSVLLELETHCTYLNKLCLHLDTVGDVLDSDPHFKSFHNQISRVAIDMHSRILKLRRKQKHRKN